MKKVTDEIKAEARKYGSYPLCSVAIKCCTMPKFHDTVVIGASYYDGGLFAVNFRNYTSPSFRTSDEAEQFVAELVELVCKHMKGSVKVEED